MQEKLIASSEVHKNKLAQLYAELDARNENGDFFVHFSTSNFGNKKSNGSGGTSFCGKAAVKKTAHINNGIIEKIIKISAFLGIRAAIEPSFNTVQIDEKNVIVVVSCRVQLFDMDDKTNTPLYDITDGTQYENKGQTPVKAAFTDAKKRAFYGLGVLGDLRNIPELYVDEKYTDLNQYLYEALSVHLNAQEGDEHAFSDNDCFFITLKTIDDVKYAVLEWYKKGDTQNPINYKGESYILKWEYNPPAAVEQKETTSLAMPTTQLIPNAWCSESIGFATTKLATTMENSKLHPDFPEIVIYNNPKTKTQYLFMGSEDNNVTYNLLINAMRKK